MPGGDMKEAHIEGTFAVTLRIGPNETVEQLAQRAEDAIGTTQFDGEPLTVCHVAAKTVNGHKVRRNRQPATPGASDA